MGNLGVSLESGSGFTSGGWSRTQSDPIAGLGDGWANGICRGNALGSSTGLSPLGSGHLWVPSRGDTSGGVPAPPRRWGHLEVRPRLGPLTWLNSFHLPWLNPLLGLAGQSRAWDTPGRAPTA